MNAILYPATFTAAPEGGYIVTFPDLPEAVTEGDTLEQAVLHAVELLTLTLDARVEEGLEIPNPSRRRGARQRLIAPDAKTQAALLIRQARGTQPLTSLATALGTSWAAAQRLENPRHWPTLRQLEHAAAATGKRLVLTLA